MFVGTFTAFDRHMNVVLADTEEFRRIKSKSKIMIDSNKWVSIFVSDDDKEIKRSIGFVLIRGETIISLTAEAPPAPEPKRPDVMMMTGRGAPMPPPRPGMMPMMMTTGAQMGLEGPVRGICKLITMLISTKLLYLFFNTAGMPQF